MDPSRNPYAPGAGTQSPELAGRSALLEQARIGVERIRAQDVHTATQAAIGRLDESFFRVRYDRLTPRERDYLRAMAELGSGAHRSGDIADRLGVPVQSVGPLRSGLIRKGMIYSPAHGDTAFTVPLFDEYLRRTIPAWIPRRS